MLGELVNRRRREHAEKSLRQARLEEYAYRDHPLFGAHVERNRELAERTQALTKQIEQADAELRQTRQKLETIRREFAQTKEKVASVDLTARLPRSLAAVTSRRSEDPSAPGPSLFCTPRTASGASGSGAHGTPFPASGPPWRSHAARRR
jgi:septal ring factor EnvC (AmiA/AmiB activator)